MRCPDTYHIITILKKYEFDRAVLYSISTRLWVFISGPISMFIIISKFTSEVQGYYYTFGSVLAVQSFFELGFGYAIVQFISHEWAQISFDDRRGFSGHPENLSRLKALAYLSIKWHVTTGCIVTLALIILGFFFFDKSNDNIRWWQPWIYLCVATGISISLNTIWTLLEGCNQILNLYRFRFFQGLVANLAMWVSLLLGANLWSMPITSFIVILYSIAFLSNSYSKFLRDVFSLKKTIIANINWLSEIFPFQSRIAISFLSGYFLSNFFTPVLFHYHGPIVAGQMGMTWNLIFAVFMISVGYFNPKIPQFGILAAKKDYISMDALLYRILKVVLFINILGAASILMFLYIVNICDYFFSKRLLSLLPTAIFLIGIICHSMASPFSIYLRAHKQEPLYHIALGSGIIMGLAIWVLGKYFSVLGVAMGYSLVHILTFPIVILIFYKFRKRWHITANN